MAEVNQAIAQIMNERFGHDCLVSLATHNGALIDARVVNGYYENGAFYVITHALSGKMQQIRTNPGVAICGDWFTAHGVAENLGHVLKPENARIDAKLRDVFSTWYGARHSDDSDPNLIILKIHLTDGVLISQGARYHVDFTKLYTPN